MYDESLTDTVTWCNCRLAKEKVMYEKEAKQQEEKIEKMKAEACDDYGIKKQVNHTKTCKILLCFDLMSLKQTKLLYFFFLPRLLQTKTYKLQKSQYTFIYILHTYLYTYYIHLYFLPFKTV
uniref:Tubulin-specific chaperone A n=1 Tax=Pavo cristatus TaxID=9049 RepID=A0A8C9G094_PAVCR